MRLMGQLDNMKRYPPIVPKHLKNQYFVLAHRSSLWPSLRIASCFGPAPRGCGAEATNLVSLDGCLGVPFRLLSDPREPLRHVIDEHRAVALSWSRIMIRDLLGEPSLEDAIMAETIT